MPEDCLDRDNYIDTPEFLSLNSAMGLWPASRHGEDVVIGVLGSGIWPESSSFKDHGMATSDAPTKWKGKCDGGQDFNSSLCNSKLMGVRYFQEGLKSKINPRFNDSARDITGHETHCSSIAAGNYVSGASYFGYALGTAKGVAPRARLAVYKVLWTAEHLNNGADITAAFDKAIADGVDVISASWSYEPMLLHRDPLAKASFAAMKKGIVVSTAAGNHGPEIGTLRNGIPWVLTITAGRYRGPLVCWNLNFWEMAWNLQTSPLLV